MKYNLKSFNKGQQALFKIAKKKSTYINKTITRLNKAIINYDVFDVITLMSILRSQVNETDITMHKEAQKIIKILNKEYHNRNR